MAPKSKTACADVPLSAKAVEWWTTTASHRGAITVEHPLRDEGYVFPLMPTQSLPGGRSGA